MATSDAIQAELTGIQRISKSTNIDATYDMHYVSGNDKACWCRTTLANTAAQQAAEIVAVLAAPGPLDANLL